MPAETEIREQVRRRYAASAVGADEGCCGPDCCGPLGADPSTPLYDEADLKKCRRTPPPPAWDAATQWPSPTSPRARSCSIWDRAGGSTCFSRLVGSAQRVRLRVGHDRRDARPGPPQRRRSRAGNVEFLRGYIEDIPLQGATVDVVISNCVINLSADKRTGRDPAGAPTRGTDRDHGHRGRRPPRFRSDRRARQLGGVHRRSAHLHRLPARAVGGRTRGRHDHAHPRCCRRNVVGDGQNQQADLLTLRLRTR